MNSAPDETCLSLCEAEFCDLWIVFYMLMMDINLMIAARAVFKLSSILVQCDKKWRFAAAHAAAKSVTNNAIVNIVLGFVCL